MNTNNSRLNRMVQNGWTPTMHAEFLDVYNGNSLGGVTSTILTGIDYRNMHYVVIEPHQNNNYMIAKIYPPSYQGVEDGTHKKARYFSIRKLTEGECLRLMDVPGWAIERMVNSPTLSKSAIYKLAGNSIVVSCLFHIFRKLYFSEPSDDVQQSLFASLEEDSRLPIPDRIRMVTLCSGYDSQLLAMQRLAEWMQSQGYQKPDVDLVAWAEYDPESKQPVSNQPAVKAHNILFPEFADRNLGDMTRIDWQSFVKEHPDAHDIDVLTYSTPCQSISQSGKREGMDKGSGTRSAVLWYTEEAIRVLRPKVLLQENVKALVNKKNMPNFHKWQNVCTSLGYDNYYTVMNAKDYGVPQNRERVFMVSIRRDLDISSYTFPNPFKLSTRLADVLQEDVNDSYFLKPTSVIKFLQTNEEDKGKGIIYRETDHYLSDEEINAIRDEEAALHSQQIQDGRDA